MLNSEGIKENIQQFLEAYLINQSSNYRRTSKKMFLRDTEAVLLLILLPTFGGNSSDLHKLKYGML